MNELNDLYEPFVKDKKGNVNPEVMKKLILATEGKMTFSWCALFFNATYFFYRKCYIEGILFLSVIVIVSIMLPLGYIISLVAGGFLFYPIYKARIQRNIKMGELPEIKGGTNVPIVWICIAFNIILGMFFK